MKYNGNFKLTFCPTFMDEVQLRQGYMGFNCLKATEPLQRDSLRFTTKALEVPCTHFIELGRMKG